MATEQLLELRASFADTQCYRLIRSKFPPISLFDDVASADEFDAIHALQALTNPRLQDQLGNVTLVAPEDRVYGAARGAGYVMAAFTHINPDGSRFATGDFGAWYGACHVDVAIAETIHHVARFMGYTSEPAQRIDMRCLSARFSGSLVDVRGLALTDPIYAASDYGAGQALANIVKRQGLDGIAYRSVRDVPGHRDCYAIFRPACISDCVQAGHYAYVWDGAQVSHVLKQTLHKTVGG